MSIKGTKIAPETVTEADLKAGKIVAVPPTGHVLSVSGLEQSSEGWLFNMPGQWSSVFKLDPCILFKVEVVDGE